MTIISINSTLSDLDPLTLSLSSPVVPAIHTFNLFLSLPLNIYIIILLLRAEEPEGSGFYKLNQTVSEIGLTLQMPLLVLCSVNLHFCFPCPIAFITCTCLSTRFSFQCCVCYECYLAVVHPITFLRSRSRPRRVATAGSLWASSLLCGVASAINYLNFPYSGFGFLFLLILSVHLFFVFSILRVLKRPGPGEKTSKDGGVSVVKMKALKFISFSLLTFVVQFTPLTSAFIMKGMVPSDVFHLAFIISININNATGVVQPILFLHQMGKFTFGVCKCNQRAPP